jgi:RNA polymerase sigma-B factor
MPLPPARADGPDRPSARRPLSGRERERLVLDHMRLVERIARRYDGRGEEVDDLVQVGMVGLVKAAQRFDPALGTNFTAYAVPTVVGEIRRHFRDRCWGVHMPRGLQERCRLVGRCVDHLRMREGRSPGVPEVARETGLSEEEVLEAMGASLAFRPRSLSAPATGDGEELEIELGVDDDSFQLAEGRASIADGLRRLPARERVILYLYFDEGLTQTEIARMVGISQMHVSRLIARGLDLVRSSGERPLGPAGLPGGLPSTP